MFSLDKKKTPQYTKLLYVHIILTLAIFSWFAPITKHFWEFIDAKGFYLLNSILNTSRASQNICAFMNSRAADWLYDVVILTLLFTLVYLPNRRFAPEKIFSIFYIILFTIFCHCFYSNFIFSNILVCNRISPSAVLKGGVMISDTIKWTIVKDVSYNCFPSNHACTSFMFIVGIFHLTRPKYGLIALFVSLPFILPRFIFGAHWATDLLLGSLPLAIFNLSWLFYTPYFAKLVKVTGEFYVRRIVGKRLQKGNETQRTHTHFN